MTTEWSAKEMTAYCDTMNGKAGKEPIRWLQITPEDNPNHYLGLDPKNNTIVGPAIDVGRRYRIVYSSPVRLPFRVEGEGNVALHVAEIKGTILNPFLLSDVEYVVCQPDDHSVKMNIRADKSAFRLFMGDELEPL